MEEKRLLSPLSLDGMKKVLNNICDEHSKFYYHRMFYARGKNCFYAMRFLVKYYEKENNQTQLDALLKIFNQTMYIYLDENFALYVEDIMSKSLRQYINSLACINKFEPVKLSTKNLQELPIYFNNLEQKFKNFSKLNITDFEKLDPDKIQRLADDIGSCISVFVEKYKDARKENKRIVKERANYKKEIDSTNFYYEKAKRKNADKTISKEIETLKYDDGLTK